MASKTFHFPSFSIVKGDIKVNVSLNRFEKQFQEAQNWLDGRVFTDMEKYMPFRDGNMRNVSAIMSRSMQGSGQVIAGAPPYGRFLYERKVMVDLSQAHRGQGPERRKWSRTETLCLTRQHIHAQQTIGLMLQRNNM